MNRSKSFVLTIAISIACASPSVFAVENGGRDYTTGETGRAYNIRTGVIVDMREVDLRQPQMNYSPRPQFDTTDACAGIGIVAGGVIGNKIGGGNGRIIATLIGAAAGGVGAKTACTPSQQKALELTIKLDSGAMVGLVQGIDVDIRIGDRVRLVEGQKTRVSRITY